MLALAVTSRTAAIAPEVKDEGKFFSAEAIKKANDEIREIMRKYDRDVLVETFVTVPDTHKEKVKAMSPKERNEFFRSWANDRIQTNVVNGVYILVCADPTYVRIEITAKAQSVFDRAVYEKLGKLLLGQFKMKNFDAGLLAAVKFIRAKLDEKGK
jgi:uncharacterized membrane protein YgcG